GDLRAAIGAARNLQLVHGVRLLSGDGLDADDALMLGLVRQHRRAGAIADGIDARDIGAAITLDDTGAIPDLHAELLEAELLDIADHANRRDHAFRLDLLLLAVLGLDRGGDRVARLRDLRDLGLGENLDAVLLEALARQRGDLGILDRQDLRQD